MSTPRNEAATISGMLQASPTVLVSEESVYTSHTVPVLTQDESDDDKLGYLRMKKKAILILIGSILLVAGVGLAAGLLVTTSLKTSEDSPGESTTTVATDFQERFIAMRSALAEFSDPTKFVSPDTPQSKALAWLVAKDQYVQLEQVSHLIVQRYAIMVLFYANSGSDWAGFAVPLDEETETSECLFKGVECNEGGEIVALDLSSQHMAGRLPDEIASLTMLTSLNLSNNYLEGSLPKNLYKKLSDLGKFLTVRFLIFEIETPLTRNALLPRGFTSRIQ
jgi:hypothetical protein